MTRNKDIKIDHIVKIIAKQAASHRIAPNQLERIMELAIQDLTIDLTRLKNHGPLSNDAKQSMSPVLSDTSRSFMFSGNHHASLASDSSSAHSTGSDCLDRAELRKPLTPKVIEYAPKVESSKPKGVSCYPGTEQNWTEEKRDFMCRVKLGLVECCLDLSVIVHWFPFVDKPTTQRKDRRADWRIYLSEIERNLDTIATYFFDNGNYKQKYPDYFDFGDRKRRGSSV